MGSIWAAKEDENAAMRRQRMARRIGTLYRCHPGSAGILPAIAVSFLKRTPDMSGDGTRLPLVPLADLVHFPRTELRLHVTDPSFEPLVQDLTQLDEEARWLGVVLLKPGWRQGRAE